MGLTFSDHRTSPSYLVLSNILFILALGSAKDSLLLSDAEVPWVVVRVLACGALAVGVAWIFTGQSVAKKSVEVSTHSTITYGVSLIYDFTLL